MRRWLASQSSGRPTRNIISGLLIMAAGLGIILSSGGAARYFGAGFIVLGAFNVAIGIAALLASRSVSVD